MNSLHEELQRLYAECDQLQAEPPERRQERDYPAGVDPVGWRASRARLAAEKMRRAEIAQQQQQQAAMDPAAQEPWDKWCDHRIWEQLGPSINDSRPRCRMTTSALFMTLSRNCR